MYIFARKRCAFLTRTSSNIHTQHTTSLRFSKKPARSRLSLLSYPVVSFISLLLLRCLRLLRLRLLRRGLLRCLRLLGSGLLRSLLRLLRRGLLLSVVRLSWVFLVVSISVFVFICGNVSAAMFEDKYAPPSASSPSAPS